MTKQHYFAIFAEQNNAGVIEWRIDTEMPLASGDNPIYNTDTNEWESIKDNHHEDARIAADLISRLTKRED
jgi:hypothetical protein